MFRPTVFYTLLLLVLVGTCVRAQPPYSTFRFEHEGETVDLLTLMARSQTPEVSMALDNGIVDSAFTATTQPVSNLHPNTRFPAGSASGLPVCVAVLQLVERGEIQLDDPINPLLGDTPLKHGDALTVRDVLLLKPRMGSDYKPAGFAAGEARPCLRTVMNGFRYRGLRPASKSTEYGSWALLQRLLENHYGKPLHEVIEREVFQPLCLEHSFYATELTAEQAKSVAQGHLDDGEPMPDGYRRYVVHADAGLWTTAVDYVKLMRSLLDSNAGKTGGLLRPATVRMAMAERWGHRSLLFHVSENGLPYWGGNAKGYYFSMQAHPEENWVSVVMMNRDLNWRLGSPVVWQLGLLAKQWRAEERLGIILQDENTDLEMVRQLEQEAFVQGVRTERIPASGGLPEGITATPAFVFQSPAGRAVYGGRHDDLSALQRFVRLSQASPKKTAVELRADLLVLHRGRQTIVLPLKLTPPTGVAAPEALPALLVTSLREALTAATGFTQAASVELNAQDRRLYLDVHAYRTATGDYQMTYALFSQFDCHTPMFTSFGHPVTVSATGQGTAALASAIAQDLGQLLDPQKGFVPAHLRAVVAVRSWEDLGWNLDQAVLANQEVTFFATPVAVDGTYRAALRTEDAPGLFFSFPAPLDRYAGEVREMEVEFTFSNAGRTVAGRVALPVASIATSSGSLDTYVLGDILKSKKYPTASLVFGATPVKGDWRTGQTLAMTIPATLMMRGKAHPVVIKAAFTPGASGTLAAAADFSIHFSKFFGMDAPDGPEAIRNQLDFTARFTATSTNRAR